MVSDGWSDVPPVNLDQIDEDPDALECPLCGGEIIHTPSHDESIDGLELMAVPDVYTCYECGEYRYSE